MAVSDGLAAPRSAITGDDIMTPPRSTPMDALRQKQILPRGYRIASDVVTTISHERPVYFSEQIQIEDQEYPKKRGHTPGRRVVPIEDAARRIKVASEARYSKDLMIIARTDARTALGLDEALRRCEAFLKAGADILFIESPQSVDEMQKIGRIFNVPLAPTWWRADEPNPQPR